MDSAGNVYVAGQFQRTVSFGGTDETTTGTGGYLISWAPDGSYRWHVVTIGVPLAVTVGPTDQVLIAGYQYTGTGRGLQAPFVEAIDVDGVSLWRTLAAPEGGSGVFSAISASAEGVVAAGHFSGRVDFGGGLRITPSGRPTPRSGIVAQYSMAGSYLRDTVIESTGAQVGDVYLAANSSSITVVGQYAGGPVRIDGTSYANEGEADLFVARLDRASASVVSSAAFAGTGDVSVNGVVVDSASNAYIVGEFDGAMSFGGGMTETSPSDAILGFRPLGFILSVDAGSSRVWHRTVRPVSGESRSAVGAIAVDAMGVLVAGRVVGAFDFGGGLRGDSLESTVFRASYTFEGGYRNDQVVRTTPRFSEGDVKIMSMAVGVGGITVYGGTFQGRVDLGSGRRTSAGNIDCFVVRVGT